MRKVKNGPTRNSMVRLKRKEKHEFLKSFT